MNVVAQSPAASGVAVNWVITPTSGEPTTVPVTVGAGPAAQPAPETSTTVNGAPSLGDTVNGAPGWAAPATAAVPVMPTAATRAPRARRERSPRSATIDATCNSFPI